MISLKCLFSWRNPVFSRHDLEKHIKQQYIKLEIKLTVAVSAEVAAVVVVVVTVVVAVVVIIQKCSIRSRTEELKLACRHALG